MKTNIPTEAQEQILLFQWINLSKGKYPELELAFHIPNGGSRHKLEAANLKKQGVKSGVPDIFIPVARDECHGLFIEMKRKERSVTSKVQVEWLDNLMRQGYKVAICKGWEVAREVIIEYLESDG